MKSDSQLQKEVGAELEWDPAINAAHVGVTVKDGVMTLSDHLEKFADKSAVQPTWRPGAHRVLSASSMKSK